MARPASAKVRAVYLLPDGELVVDFSYELAQDHQKSTSAEALLVYGVANTLTQAAVKGEREQAVRTVRFLVEGSTPHEWFECHLDLSEAVAPNPRWIQTPKEVRPGDA